MESNKKINIAELLEKCPKGMKLYSPIFGEVYLDRVRPHLSVVVTIDKEQGNSKKEFLYDGRYAINGECMLFPSKDKDTWEGFIPPKHFKDGDIVVNALGNTLLIYKGQGFTNRFYVVYDIEKDEIHFESIGWFFSRLATTEEQEKLFQKLKDKGYKWNEEKKCVEKLPKFKDGDVIYTKINYNEWVSIFKKEDNGNIITYIDYELNSGPCFGINNESACLCSTCSVKEKRLASENEKNKLFKRIKDEGYTWNAETKTLEKLVKPKFKVGDIIKSKVDDENILFKIKEIQDNDYIIVSIYVWKMPIKRQEDFELVPNKFDITTLEPFQEVLVRNYNTDEWDIDLFGYYSRGFYHTTGRGLYRQCIPYKGNEYLRGTSKDCKEYYKTWEK